VAIKWKEMILETVAEDGIVLRGIIRYWSKEYSLEMTEPIQITLDSAHLMYMIPAKFVVDENVSEGIKQADSRGVKCINLYFLSIEKMKQLYREMKCVYQKEI